MKEYVVGFAFSNNLKNVLLINKLKPEWQIGKLNGIGGKIEKFDKSPLDAMVREMGEESGLITDNFWKQICIFEGENHTWRVFIFACKTDNIYNFENKTEEKCQVCEVNHLPDNVIDNLRWVIPMCFDASVNPTTKVFFYEL